MKRWIGYLTMLWVFVLYTLPAFAQEAVTSAGQAADDAPLWVKIVAGFWMLVAAVVLPYVRSRIKKGESNKEKAETKIEAMETLANSAAAIYLSYVQPLKSVGKKIDGAKARGLAFDKAKEMAPATVKALYDAWGKEKVLSLIHRIANKQSAGKSSRPKTEAIGDGDAPSPA